MTKNEIISTLKAAAARHGFLAEDNTWMRWPYIHETDTHYLNFTITDEYAEDTDWSKREVTVNVRIRASLASMGGNPTPEELIRASEIIREGAALMQELEAMNLSYTETY